MLLEVGECVPAVSDALSIPADGPQTFDRIEMRIPCCQCKIMDKAGGGDPAIVLRNHATHFRKPRLHHTVALGDLIVQMHGLRQRQEGSDAQELLFHGVPCDRLHRKARP